MASEREIARLAEASWGYVSAAPWADLGDAERQAHMQVVGAVLSATTQAPAAPQPPFRPVPLRDERASVISLARTILLDIQGKPEVTIPGPRLELLLRTLIDSGDAGQSGAQEAMARTVAGHIEASRAAASRVGELPA